MKTNIIYNEDCIGKKGMRILSDKSIDMILCDMPYGTTACKWDIIIPFEPLWEQYKRIIKDNGAIVLTASQPFTSKLVMSNLKMFKYEWIWDKVASTTPMLAKIMPLKKHENILIFGNGKLTYNPQMTKGKKWSRAGVFRKAGYTGSTEIIGKRKGDESELKYPKSIIKFSNANKIDIVHPTQKLVALFEYLIKTYTNEDDIVLDNCIGSGTTAVACVHLKRYYIGFDTSKKYCRITEQRLEAEKTLWDIKENKEVT